MSATILFLLAMAIGLILGHAWGTRAARPRPKPEAPAEAPAPPPQVVATPEQIAAHRAYIIKEKAEFLAACRVYGDNPHDNVLLRQLVDHLIDRNIPFELTSDVRILSHEADRLTDITPEEDAILHPAGA